LASLALLDAQDAVKSRQLASAVWFAVHPGGQHRRQTRQQQRP